MTPPPAHPGADQSLRLVAVIGVGTPTPRPRLYVTEEAARKVDRLLAGEGMAPGARFVTVNPFSRWKYKEWGSGSGPRCSTGSGRGTRSRRSSWARRRKRKPRESLHVAGTGHTTWREDHPRRTRRPAVPQFPSHGRRQRGAPYRLCGRNALDRDLRPFRLEGGRSRTPSTVWSAPTTRACRATGRGARTREASLCLEKMPVEKVLDPAREMLEEMLASPTPADRWIRECPES